MSIIINVNAISKEITAPIITVSGVSRTSNTVSQNVDGVWRQSWPSVWAINIYRYGTLVRRVYCVKGQSITLGSTTSLYSDDTFCGYSTNANSAGITYTGTQSITPTSNLDLYTVYSYVASTTSIQQVTAYGTPGQTLTVNNAVPGTKYSVYESYSSPSWEVVYYDYPIGQTVVCHTNTSTSTKVDNATVTGSTISYTFSNFQSTTLTGPMGVTGTTSFSGWITYSGYVTITGTKYRVVSYSNPSHINLYVYGGLVRTISVTEGMSVVVGSIAGIQSGDTFYGWSLTDNSVVRKYTNTSEISPHGILNLYAIFSYIVNEQGTKRVATDSSTSQSVTVAYTGTVTVKFEAYYWSPNGSSTTAKYEAGRHYCRIGNTEITSDYSGTVTADTVITFYGYRGGTSQGGGSYTTRITYPSLIATTYYRS